jgi:arginine-tRNA-protein transferase
MPSPVLIMLNVTKSTTFDPAKLQFYATSAYPCSYLLERTAKSQVAATNEFIDTVAYSSLVKHGFRRSGTFIYRPRCDQCQACVPIRIPIDDFQANRSQKRAWTKHANLQTRVATVGFFDEHYQLYTRYQKNRHPDGGMDRAEVEQYIDFLIKSHVTTWMVEFRHPSGELKMVSIIDVLSDGLSAVYTFFDPEQGNDFGTFNVLWQVKLALSLGLKHLYLGYWIETAKKMSYKTRFQPYELFMKGQWLSP